MPFKPLSQQTGQPTKLIPDAPDLVYLPGFIPLLQTELLTQQLLNELDFQPDIVKIFDKIIETKRKTDFRSDPGCSYHYSGFTKVQKPWTPTLLTIKSQIESESGSLFNACLCNLYENGEAAMGWHADDEIELGAEPTIASLSLGATRNFDFQLKKPYRSPESKPIRYELKTGDLIIMKGKTQDFWEHRITPSKKVQQLRINLTFRKVIHKKNAG